MVGVFFAAHASALDIGKKYCRIEEKTVKNEEFH